MNNLYQMNYRAPIAESWNRTPVPSSETADDVSTMLERLKDEANSLESYFAELENELKRVHLKRAVLSKKLGALSELVMEVEALRTEPAAAMQTVAWGAEKEVASVRRSSRTKWMLSVASIVLVAIAVAFVVLEKTGHSSFCMTCAATKLLGTI